MKNEGKYMVGKINDYDLGKGWFFGQFAKEKLLQSSEVEVCLSDIDKIGFSSKDYPHYHKSAVEINIVISGCCKFELNGKPYTVEKDGFYIIYPQTIIDKFWADKGTKVIVIKLPSVRGDKFLLNKDG